MTFARKNVAVNMKTVRRNLNDSSGPRLFFDGLLDETLFFDDALIASDFTFLWNGGVGIEVPFVVDGDISNVAFSIYDKQFNAFKELSGKNTII